MALGWPGTLVSLQCRDLPVGKRLRKRTKERSTEKPKRMGSALKWGGTKVSLVILQISHGGIKCSSLPVDRELRKGSKEKGT